MKHALIAASLVLVAGTTVGCGAGGSSSSPDSASTDDFCTAYNSLFESFSGATATPSDAESVKAIRDWADKMKEAGTPSDIPDDARHGFELVLDTIDKVDDNASQADIQKLGDDLSADDKKASEAFGAYATKTCPSAVPSDLPT